MHKGDFVTAGLGLIGALIGGLLAYCGAVITTKQNLEHERLSAAYASYASSLAQHVSPQDLVSVIEARTRVALYGEADVLKKLAADRLPCDGEWFLKAVNRIRSQIGRRKLNLETARKVLCGPEKLTAQLNCPTESDSPITCELHFSEQVPLSYVTLRDRAIKVTNGTVSRAQRMDPAGDEHNRHWKITVTPNLDETVTILLRGNRDCTKEDAICTALGKQLSNDVCQDFHFGSPTTPNTTSFRAEPCT